MKKILSLTLLLSFASQCMMRSSFTKFSRFFRFQPRNTRLKRSVSNKPDKRFWEEKLGNIELELEHLKLYTRDVKRNTDKIKKNTTKKIIDPPALITVGLIQLAAYGCLFKIAFFPAKPKD